MCKDIVSPRSVGRPPELCAVLATSVEMKVRVVTSVGLGTPHLIFTDTGIMLVGKSVPANGRCMGIAQL